MANDFPLRFFSFIAFAGHTLSTAAFAYTLVHMKKDNIKVELGIPVTASHAADNINWYQLIVSLICCLFSLCSAIYELFLIINPLKFGSLKTGASRFLIDLVIGFSVLGVTGDLGIAAGFILLFSAVFTICIWMAWKCKCVQFGYNQIPDGQPQDSKATIKEDN